MARPSKSQVWGRAADRLLVTIGSAALVPSLLSFLRWRGYVDERAWFIGSIVAGLAGLVIGYILSGVLRKRWTDGSDLLDGLWLPYRLRLGVWAVCVAALAFAQLAWVFPPTPPNPVLIELLEAANERLAPLEGKEKTEENVAEYGLAALTKDVAEGSIPGSFSVGASSSPSLRETEENPNGQQPGVQGDTPGRGVDGYRSEDEESPPNWGNPIDIGDGKTKVVVNDQTTKEKGGFDIGGVFFPPLMLGQLFGWGIGTKYREVTLRTLHEMVQSGKAPNLERLRDLASQVKAKHRESWKQAVLAVLKHALDEGKIDQAEFDRATGDLETILGEMQGENAALQAFKERLAGLEDGLSPTAFGEEFNGRFGQSMTEAMRKELRDILSKDPRYGGANLDRYWAALEQVIGS